MRLVSYGHLGSECAGFLDGDKVFDLEQAMKVTGAEKPVSDIRLFLEQPDWRSTLDRAYAARSKLLPAAPSRIGAPVPVPRTLIIAGANTKSHIAEAGAVLGETVGPREPMLLAKATSSICGPTDDIIYPPETRKARLRSRARGRDGTQGAPHRRKGREGLRCRIHGIERVIGARHSLDDRDCPIATN